MRWTIPKIQIVGLASAFSLLLVRDSGTVQAFVALTQAQGRQTSRLYSALDKERNNLQNVEQARAFLEDLLHQQEEFEATTKSSWSTSRDTAFGRGVTEDGGLLTTTGRHRRQLEIELLKSLQKSEEGVNKLMHLWMYETDTGMAHELEDMQEICSAGMVAEEIRLREMIRESPHWAEPRARLALLLFFKGRTTEAFDAAMDTLRIKPWHFEIYPLLVMISLREQNFGQALVWARRALPPLRPAGPNKRREEWVRIAVELAQQRYAEAEQRTAVSKEEASLSSLGAVTEDAWQ